jgi:hypothetical protein
LDDGWLELIFLFLDTHISRKFFCCRKLVCFLFSGEESEDPSCCCWICLDICLDIWLDMVGWVVGLVLATGEDNLMIKPGGLVLDLWLF